ncbi:uncharacterized protein LOC123554214 isoform X2 [Mercenaria mercenaria]|nr:uncharacterized protein LOC123554214 isoform X2 [Mercenaria mercenaria]
MQRERYNISFLVLYAFVHIQVVMGCSCAWMPVEDMYCMRDYAIKATVLTELSPPWQDNGFPEGVSTTTESWLDQRNKYLEFTYEIGIESVYRSTPGYESAVKIITTGGYGGCMRRLVPGTTYFLMGYVSNPYTEEGFSTLTISHCDAAFDMEYSWSAEVVEGLISNPPVCEEPEYSLDDYLRNHNLEKKNSVPSNVWKKKR